MTDEGSGRSPFLTESGTLINAERARIDPRKLTEYALDPDHTDGGHKAYVFERVLGFDRTNWQSLMEQVLAGVRSTPARPARVNQHGVRFTVDIMVVGPNGAQAMVRTGWIYHHDEDDPVPRLTTLYIP